MIELNVNGNNLTNLDLSANSALEIVEVMSNANLSTLNIKNGNNEILNTLKAQDNPSLMCIQVDEEIIGNIPEGWLKDQEATYSPDCEYLGVDEFTKENMISVYPNPVKDILHLNLPQNLSLNSIKIYTISGKEIFSSTEKTKTIDFSSFQVGVYFVEMSYGKKRILKRVIKQ